MYTFHEAQEFCAAHGYVVGRQIKKGLRIFGTVEALLLAPMDGINQHRFLRAYKETRNAKKALQFYDGTLYTVLACVVPVANKQDFYTVELEHYLASESMPERQLSLS